MSNRSRVAALAILALALSAVLFVRAVREMGIDPVPSVFAIPPHHPFTFKEYLESLATLGTRSSGARLEGNLYVSGLPPTPIYVRRIMPQPGRGPS